MALAMMAVGRPMPLKNAVVTMEVGEASRRKWTGVAGSAEAARCGELSGRTFRLKRAKHSEERHIQEELRDEGMNEALRGCGPSGGATREW